MGDTEKTVFQLGLTVESERSPLQEAVAGKRALLAAVYPHRRRIVLFERNIEKHCREHNLSLEQERERLVRHEIFHYREWLRCRRERRWWRPRCWKEELRARRATRD